MSNKITSTLINKDKKTNDIKVLFHDYYDTKIEGVLKKYVICQEFIEDIEILGQLKLYSLDEWDIKFNQ